MNISINTNVSSISTSPLPKAEDIPTPIKPIDSSAQSPSTTKNGNNDKVAAELKGKNVKEVSFTMKDSTTNTELTAKYYVDKDTNQYVVQFLNRDKTVVKQIPAEFMIELAKHLSKDIEKYKGLFVEESV